MISPFALSSDRRSRVSMEWDLSKDIHYRIWLGETHNLHKHEVSFAVTSLKYPTHFKNGGGPTGLP